MLTTFVFTLLCAVVAAWIYYSQYRRVRFCVAKPKGLKTNINVHRKSYSLFIGTWNVGDAVPPESLQPWIPRGEYDIYVIGVQECYYKSKTGVEEDWFGRLGQHLGDQYVQIAGLSVRDSIRIVAFAKKRLSKHITNIETAYDIIALPVFMRKGAVGIRFSLHETTLCFVNSHLEAHQGKVKARNANTYDILDGVRLGCDPYDISNQFDHMFWMGDLNYRIDVNDGLDNKKVHDLITAQDWKTLQENDQLYKARRNGYYF